jgi:hypothetical protein
VAKDKQHAETNGQSDEREVRGKEETRKRGIYVCCDGIKNEPSFTITWVSLIRRTSGYQTDKYIPPASGAE